MQLIHTHGVQKLYERVDTLSQQPHDSWRCVYLRLRNQALQSRRDAYAHFILQPVVNLLTGSKGTIYLCEDGDIFLLFQGRTAPILDKLRSHLGDSTHGSSKKSLFRVFEYNLGTHWETFHAVCESKYLKALAAREHGEIILNDISMSDLERMAAKPHKKPLAMPKIRIARVTTPPQPRLAAHNT